MLKCVEFITDRYRSTSRKSRSAIINLSATIPRLAHDRPVEEVAHTAVREVVHLRDLLGRVRANERARARLDHALSAARAGPLTPSTRASPAVVRVALRIASVLARIARAANPPAA